MHVCSILEYLFDAAVELSTTTVSGSGDQCYGNHYIQFNPEIKLTLMIVPMVVHLALAA